MTSKTENNGLNVNNVLTGAQAMAEAKVDLSTQLESAINELLSIMREWCPSRCKLYAIGSRCKDPGGPPCGLSTLMGAIPGTTRRGFIARILSFDKTIKD